MEATPTWAAHSDRWEPGRELNPGGAERRLVPKSRDWVSSDPPPPGGLRSSGRRATPGQVSAPSTLSASAAPGDGARRACRTRPAWPAPWSRRTRQPWPAQPPDRSAVPWQRPRQARRTRNRFRGGGFLAADPARTVTRRPRRKCGRRIPSRIPSRARGSGLAGAAGSRDGKPMVRRPAAPGLRAQPVLPGAVRAAVRAADRRRQGESRPARLLTGAPPLPLAWLKLGLPTSSPLPGSPNPTARSPASQPGPALPRAS